jgi:hypothetical protein
MKTHTQDLGQKKHTFKCFAHKSFILVLGYLQVMIQWPIGCVALKLCETMVFWRLPRSAEWFYPWFCFASEVLRRKIQIQTKYKALASSIRTGHFICADEAKVSLHM